jgi:Co/Zn/Cd efflux system component
VANNNVLAEIIAAAVKLLDSGWPDIVVGVAIAALFLKSALNVLRESFEGVRRSRSEPAA